MIHSARGLVIAAPASGHGKTVLTLGLLRHLRAHDVRVAPIKAGPDYIDAAFHAAASGRACFNMDTWAMRPETLGSIAARAAADAEAVIAEGVMGLFDGAAGAGPGGAGSSADLARQTGWPVVLVVDAKGMAASAAALLHGFARFRDDVPIAGAIFNRVGSARHEAMLLAACAPLGIPILGFVPRDADLVLPERHLGLVQAGEHPRIESFLERAAEIATAHIDTARLIEIAKPCVLRAGQNETPIAPIGQRIAVARDMAFAFAYPHMLEALREAGAHLSFFSPLEDQTPDKACDAVFLPGGYPELHAPRLSGNARFMQGLRDAAARGANVYGECGGYMVLGQGLVDADGTRHAMAGLLPLETSFAARQRHLGYREIVAEADSPLGARGARFRGHEFHFSQVVSEDGAMPLFRARAVDDDVLQPTGCRAGSVMGSFLHLIDRAP
jgi:cobyrinic acid a,c-diamide synthase